MPRKGQVFRIELSALDLLGLILQHGVKHAGACGSVEPCALIEHTQVFNCAIVHTNISLYVEYIMPRNLCRHFKRNFHGICFAG